MQTARRVSPGAIVLGLVILFMASAGGLYLASGAAGVGADVSVQPLVTAFVLGGLGLVSLPIYHSIRLALPFGPSATAGVRGGVPMLGRRLDSFRLRDTSPARPVRSTQGSRLAFLTLAILLLAGCAQTMLTHLAAMPAFARIMLLSSIRKSSKRSTLMCR